MKGVIVWIYCSVLLAFFVFEGSLHGDQPIMNKVPRWDQGWGVQVFTGYEWSDEVLLGSDSFDTGQDESFSRWTSDVEGVYTFDKAIRVTAKLPYVWSERDERLVDGKRVVKEGSGFEDLTLALPLKRYLNEETYSGNFTINPQVRVPVGSSQVADNSWDVALNLGYEIENLKWFFNVDTTYWWQGSGAEDGDEWQLDINLGWNFRHNAALYWESDFAYEKGVESKGSHSRLEMGPAVFWDFNRTLMMRVEYKFPVWEETGSVQFSEGSEVRLGLGVVF